MGFDTFRDNCVDMFEGKSEKKPEEPKKDIIEEKRFYEISELCDRIQTLCKK